MGNLQSMDSQAGGLSKAELERMERRWAGRAGAPAGRRRLPAGRLACLHVCLVRKPLPCLSCGPEPCERSLLPTHPAGCPPRCCPAAGSSGWGAARRSWRAPTSR